MISTAFLEAPREEAVVRDLERIVGATKRWTQLVQTVSVAAHEPREGADAVVISSAVSGENPEVTAARAQHIPIVPRAEMLAEGV